MLQFGHSNRLLGLGVFDALRVGGCTGVGVQTSLILAGTVLGVALSAIGDTSVEWCVRCEV